MVELLQQLTAKEVQERQVKLDELRYDLLTATTSPLYQFRVENALSPVVGEGNVAANTMFIGEAPGLNEAKKGLPFSGIAGKYFDALLAHVGLTRELVYITNVVKDRPPKNRTPLPKGIEFYGPFLERQIEIIQPQRIVTLGRTSLEFVFNYVGLSRYIEPIGKIHGKAYTGTIFGRRVEVVSLYHPAMARWGKMMAVLTKDVEALKTIE